MNKAAFVAACSLCIAVILACLYLYADAPALECDHSTGTNCLRYGGRP